MRITHESLLRMIAAGADETSAPNARWLHGESWSLHPAPADDIRRGKANWQLVWRSPEDINAKRRAAISASAADLAALYDVIW
jgi:hypothetical protein